MILVNSYESDKECYYKIFLYSDNFEKKYEKKIIDKFNKKKYINPNIVTAFSMQLGVIPTALLFYASDIKKFCKHTLFPVKIKIILLILFIQFVIAILQFVLIYKNHLKYRNKSLYFKSCVLIGLILFPYTMTPVYFLYTKWAPIKKCCCCGKKNLQYENCGCS